MPATECFRVGEVSALDSQSIFSDAKVPTNAEALEYPDVQNPSHVIEFFENSRLDSPQCRSDEISSQSFSASSKDPFSVSEHTFTSEITNPMDSRLKNRVSIVVPRLKLVQKIVDEDRKGEESASETLCGVIDIAMDGVTLRKKSDLDDPTSSIPSDATCENEEDHVISSANLTSPRPSSRARNRPPTTPRDQKILPSGFCWLRCEQPPTIPSEIWSKYPFLLSMIQSNSTPSVYNSRLAHPLIGSRHFSTVPYTMSRRGVRYRNGIARTEQADDHKQLDMFSLSDHSLSDEENNFIESVVEDESGLSTSSSEICLPDSNMNAFDELEMNSSFCRTRHSKEENSFDVEHSNHRERTPSPRSVLVMQTFLDPSLCASESHVCTWDPPSTSTIELDSTSYESVSGQRDLIHQRKSSSEGCSSTSSTHGDLYVLR